MTAAGYTYPEWSVTLGWGLRMLSILSIPTYMFYMLCNTPGNIAEVEKKVLKI